jgi:hypothetical protein
MSEMQILLRQFDWLEDGLAPFDVGTAVRYLLGKHGLNTLNEKTVTVRSVGIFSDARVAEIGFARQSIPSRPASQPAFIELKVSFRPSRLL